MSRDQKQGFTLYNLIFPVWLIWLMPPVVLLILPANFLWDLLVTALTMRAFQVTDQKKKIRHVIVRVWLCGFLADLAGSVGLVLMSFVTPGRDFIGADWWYDKLMGPSVYNPLENPWAFLYVGLFILLSAVLIYVFNVRFCLKDAELEETKRKKLALSLAVFTAPYFFWVPITWFA